MKQKRETTTPQAVQTAERFLRFAVALAQMDLETLREGEWVTLREDFESFLTPPMGRHSGLPLPPPMGRNGGFCAVSPSEPLPQDFSLEDFRRLQRNVGLILWGRVNGRGFGGKLERQPIIISLGLLIGFQASTADCFIYLLIFLLQQEPLDRIRACPECQKLFYRVKQQAYCSHTCATRTAQRRFRERQETPIA